MIGLLLCAVAATALANPGWAREKGAERAGYERQRDRKAQKMRRDEMRDAQRQGWHHQNRRQAIQESPQAEPSPRNNGRMSPEERRALRREIREANQVMYHRRNP